MGNVFSVFHIQKFLLVAVNEGHINHFPISVRF